MDYNKFNIEEKYDSYKNISVKEAENILEKLNQCGSGEEGYDYSLLRGKMLLKIGYVEEASEELEKALAVKPTDEVYDLLSFAYYELEDYEEALKYIDLSFGITVDEYIYNHKGKILEAMERFDESFDTYYNGLKFALKTYSNFGDVEIFGENLARVGGILKKKYLKCIKEFIINEDFYNLYEYYMRLLKVVYMEEENDHYHSATEYVKFGYLEEIEAGRNVLINNNCYLEMVNIYKILYDIEKNCEYEDKDYINKEYIDSKVKDLVDTMVERTSLQKDEKLILDVLEEVIKLKNDGYYGYIYHKGYIYMKLKRYEEGLKVLSQVIAADSCEYMTKVQSYECIIKSLEDLESYAERRTETKDELSVFLKDDVERIMSKTHYDMDKKCELILQDCKRALNLKLQPEFWLDYMEKLAMYFGEQYEVINKNQSTYKIVVNYNKAIDIYDKLIKVRPDCANGYYRKGRAIVLVLRLLNSSKSSIKDVSGVHNLECFSYSEVIYNLNKAIKLKSDDGKYFNLLARTHFEIGEYDKSIAYMEHGLKLAPDDLYMNLNLICIFIRRYQYVEAVDYMFKIACRDVERKAVRKTFLPKREILNFFMGIFNLYPRQDKIYFIMAYYFYAIEDYQESKAMKFIGSALSETDDERYYFLRAKILFKSGKYEEALKNIDEAIGIDDHYDEAYLLKEKCENIIKAL